MKLCLSLLPLLALAGCNLEPIHLSPCSVQGRLGFRVHEIEGLLWDYQPRPSWIVVRGERSSPVWMAHINGLERLENRPERPVLLYAQRLTEWEVDVPAKRLRDGTKYRVFLNDGGRSGETYFTAGAPMPTC